MVKKLRNVNFYFYTSLDASKTCVISGTGYETAKWIAMLGAKVILAVRSEERGISVCICFSLSLSFSSLSDSLNHSFGLSLSLSGYETAKWIAMLGAKVILAVCSEQRGNRFVLSLSLPPSLSVCLSVSDYETAK